MGLLSWLEGKESGKEEVLEVDEHEHLDGLSLNDVITGHMKWKHRLGSYADGTSEESLVADNIEDARICQLGQWLYEQGKSQYGDSSEWSDLEATHAKFHALAAQIVRQIDQGDKQAADALLQGEFKELSSHIQLDLALLYKKIREM